jgi:hypothetical protein
MLVVDTPGVDVEVLPLVVAAVLVVLSAGLVLPVMGAS